MKLFTAIQAALFLTWSALAWYTDLHIDPVTVVIAGIWACVIGVSAMWAAV